MPTLLPIALGAAGALWLAEPAPTPAPSTSVLRIDPTGAVWATEGVQLRDIDIARRAYGVELVRRRQRSAVAMEALGGIGVIGGAAGAGVIAVRQDSTPYDRASRIGTVVAFGAIVTGAILIAGGLGLDPRIMSQRKRFRLVDRINARSRLTRLTFGVRWGVAPPPAF